MNRNDDLQRAAECQLDDKAKRKALLFFASLKS